VLAATATARPSSDIPPKRCRISAGMIPFSQIVQGRTGICARWVNAARSDGISLFERVDKPTDNKTSRLLRNRG